MEYFTDRDWEILGEEAYVNGDSPDANPFDEGTPAYEAWERGFNQSCGREEESE